MRIEKKEQSFWTLKTTKTRKVLYLLTPLLKYYSLTDFEFLFSELKKAWLEWNQIIANNELTTLARIQEMVLRKVALTEVLRCVVAKRNNAAAADNELIHRAGKYIWLNLPQNSKGIFTTLLKLPMWKLKIK